MSALKYWIWLSSLSGIGPVTAARLLDRFGSPYEVFNADAKEYMEVEGIRSSDIAKLAEKDVGAANKILASCAGSGIRILTFQDAEYPDRLRNIYDPPIVLYIRGALPIIDEEAVVGVVGTRDCTPYGIGAADSIGYKLARSGLVVSTGLARGIDSAATRGALRGGGRVIGLVGAGPDIVYPPENRQLFDDVASSGAIVSEYPPGTPAVRSHFPMRNRIISGISLGVAVVEAPKRSGALITASRALEQGRDVFTMPGNVDARSCEGSNALLREGAIPILSGEDIVSEYADLFPDKINQAGEANTAPHANEPPRPDSTPRQKVAAAGDGATKKVIDNALTVDYIDVDKIASALTGDEKAVAEVIGAEIRQIDEIIVMSGLSAQKVQVALTMLEIKGYAEQAAGKRYRLTESKT